MRPFTIAISNNFFAGCARAGDAARTTADIAGIAALTVPAIATAPALATATRTMTAAIFRVTFDYLWRTWTLPPSTLPSVL